MRVCSGALVFWCSTLWWKMVRQSKLTWVYRRTTSVHATTLLPCSTAVCCWCCCYCYAALICCVLLLLAMCTSILSTRLSKLVHRHRQQICSKNISSECLLWCCDFTLFATKMSDLKLHVTKNAVFRVLWSKLPQLIRACQHKPTTYSKNFIQPQSF